MKNIKNIATFFIISLCTLNISTNSNENDALNDTVPSQEQHQIQEESQAQEETFDETIFNWSRTLAQAMDMAHKKHYKIADIKESMIKAIDGFVSTLDAHSG